MVLRDLGLNLPSNRSEIALTTIYQYLQILRKKVIDGEKKNF